MSDLFTEALKDSKKLKEIAEQDAKNRIVDALTPYIKEMIGKEVSTDFFFEQDNEEEEQNNIQASSATATAPQATTDPTGELNGQLADQENNAPISATDDNAETDKIVVDFENLLIDNGSIQIDKKELDKINVNNSTPAEENLDLTPENLETGEEGKQENQEQQQQQQQPSTTQQEVVSYKEYQQVLGNISERIDHAFFTESVSDINKETLKQRLFDLLEAIDLMKEKGTINGKQAKIQENKLEFLFLKLKEAGLRNSYNKANKNQKDTTDMKSLKEFAAKLFEEDENAKHAAKVSGVDPKLGSRKNLNVSDTSMSSSECEDSWEDASPVVAEEEQDKTVKEAKVDIMEFIDDVEHEDKKEEDDDDDTFEIDADELKKAVRDIKKESVRKKIEKLKEASDGEETESWEDGEPEGGEDPSHKKLTKENRNLMEEDEVLDNGDYDLEVGIDLPPEIEKELAELGLSDDDFDIDMSVNVNPEEKGNELELQGGDEDEEIEIVDDDEEEEEEEEVSDEMSPSTEEDQLLVDTEEYSSKNESRKFNHLMRKNKLLEKKLMATLKNLKLKKANEKELKKQLVETNLFTAKAVYYSKFLQRALNENTLNNKKVLQQIVEHLDKGKSVAETKEIYTKIDKKLNEHITASRKLGGSSSKVTSPGSAKNLTEGKAPQAGHNPEDALSPTRLQFLAGIKRNSGE